VTWSSAAPIAQRQVYASILRWQSSWLAYPLNSHILFGFTAPIAGGNIRGEKTLAAKPLPNEGESLDVWRFLTAFGWPEIAGGEPRLLRLPWVSQALDNATPHLAPALPRRIASGEERKAMLANLPFDLPIISQRPHDTAVCLPATAPTCSYIEIRCFVEFDRRGLDVVGEGR
jgi:hypothetical protein